MLYLLIASVILHLFSRLPTGGNICTTLAGGERGKMSARYEEGSNLSEFHVPALYIEMERIVKNLADLYRKDRRVPILNRETFV